MKRLAAVLTVGLIFLTGCRAGRKPEQPGSQPEPAASPPPANTTYEETAPGQPLTLLMDGNQWSCQGTENGYYDIVSCPDGSQLIYYTDYEKRIQFPLCAAPNCAHSGPECTAWTTANGLFVYQEKVYQFQIPDKTSPCLEQMELDGSGKKELLRLQKGQEFAASGVAAAGDLLYYITNETQTVQGELMTTSQLNRLNLRTGENRVIQSMEGLNQFIVGAVKDRLLLKRFQVDRQSGSYGMPEFLLMDQAGGEEPIALPEFVDAFTWICPEGERLVIVNSSESSVVSMDLNTGVCETLVTDPMFGRYPGQVLISTVQGNNLIVNLAADYYLCTGGNLKPSVHSYYSGLNRGNRILAQVEGQYLVCRDFDTVPKTLALIDQQDYWQDLDTDVVIQNS